MESFRIILRRETDQDPRRGLQQAVQAQATLEQIERQISHRYEPEELASTRARLEAVRDYFHLSKLECEAREAGSTPHDLIKLWPVVAAVIVLGTASSFIV
jgi:hypothetical protein